MHSRSNLNKGWSVFLPLLLDRGWRVVSQAGSPYRHVGSIRSVQHAAIGLLAMSYSWWQQWVPAGWWEPTGMAVVVAGGTWWLRRLVPVSRIAFFQP